MPGRYRIHGEAVFQLCAEVASNESVVQDNAARGGLGDAIEGTAV
jgi:hypothetical protein